MTLHLPGGEQPARQIMGPHEAEGRGAGYSGGENLEVMAEAERYNSFLLGILRSTFLPGVATLDFGAGIGTFALALRDMGVEVTAVELDAAQRAHLTTRSVPTWENLESIADSSFQGAYTLNVLEHIEDDAGTLEELHRVLEDGSTLVVYVPALPWLFTAMDTRVGHVRRYRRSELLERVQAAGFEVVSAEFVDSLGVLATLAYRVLGSREGTLNRRAIRAYDRFVFPLSRLCDRLLYRIIGKNLLVVARRAARDDDRAAP